MTDQRAREMFDAEPIDTIHVIYPEDVYVTEDVIIGWGHDALVNVAVDDYVRVHGVLPDGPEGEACYAIIVQGQPRPDLHGAMEILEDLGTHTFERLNIRCRVTVNRLQDVPALRSMGRRCFPKTQHDTRGAAEAQMRSIIKRDLQKDTSLIHVYECPHCACWHVGHGRGK